jgi:hypothetical protein
MVTKDQILKELEETRRDLQAFKEAYDVFQRRFIDLDQDPERKERLNGWAVVQIIMNGLILGIVKCEGLIEDYQKALEQQDLAPVISLVKGDAND